jgi:predicted RecA/RadA family phage recombinase
MKNFIQDGSVVTVTAPTGGVKAGDAILVGALFGICATDAAQTEQVELALTGVYELAKTTPLQINEGVAVSWDTGTKKVLAPASGKIPIGTCVRAAGSNDATCRVRLNGVATAAA